MRAMVSAVWKRSLLLVAGTALGVNGLQGAGATAAASTSRHAHAFAAPAALSGVAAACTAGMQYRLPGSPVCLRSSTPRMSDAAPAVASESTAFDRSLAAILLAIEQGAEVDAAVQQLLPQLDEMFIPTLASRIDAATANNADELPQLSAIMAALQQSSQQRFERARDQLQTLLAAGEINKMDSQLCGLIRKDELDAGFLYVLFKNMEDCQKSGDEATLRVLSHLHTRVQEELEKKAEPALALLHKLTRTDDAPLRGRILRHHLVPQTSVRLPDGSELPLDKPKAAQVSPSAFADAVASAVDKVLAMPLDRSLILSTTEEIRQIAKEARVVVSETYDADVLEEFTEGLTPVFARAPRLE